MAIYNPPKGKPQMRCDCFYHLHTARYPNNGVVQSWLNVEDVDSPNKRLRINSEPSYKKSVLSHIR